ncbi:MAG: PcfK-like family protein [Prevotella sp.]|jgi:hypothetical protein|nr:PcfK-like family protein [Prevotella sp.]
METTNKVQDKIKAYLDKRAKEDPLFAATYAKKGKSIKECCAYIRGRAFKEASTNEGCVQIDDDDVYGWAVHYYDEDDIKVEKLPANVRSVAGTSAPKKKEEKTEVPKLKIKPKKKEDVGQYSLFD